MRFGSLPVAAARGGVLAHSLRLPDGSVLHKGEALDDDGVAALLRAGHPEVTVALLEDSDVPEDEAALAVARALSGPGTETGRPGTGRCNVLASLSGLVTLDPARIRRVNAVHEAVTVATLHADAPVRAGDLVATVKVIPYAAPRDVVAACADAAREGDPALSVSPFRAATVALIQTTADGGPTDLDGRTETVLRHRVEGLGGRLVTTTRCAHEPDEVARALHVVLSGGHDLVLLMGVSAVCDRGDVFPLAVERAGGRILRLGIPVDPGNLLLLARVGDVPVLGVPGCARSPRRNGFDWILERVLAGRSAEELDIPGMGVGGLLKEPPERPHPRHRRDARRRSRRIAAVVLAAGRSSRMGDVNKLLAPVDGVPMVRRVTETVLRASLDPVVVVLGHAAEDVRGALDGLAVGFALNAEHAAGISTSVATGIRAVAGSVDGAMIVLGDMPWISVPDLRALVEAFAPDRRRGICAPVVERKRGNPVLWSARYFRELQTLEGDVGARHLLAVHDDDVCEVCVAGHGVLEDVDTPEALAATRAGEA
jgi:molybdenum cofactor cytidylyltransferase